MYIHVEHNDKIDPRILRTRELLINSFAKLLVEQKSIRTIAVQDVAKAAGVNRVTFYAHFKDKYELLDVWARLMFRQSVTEKITDSQELNEESLTLLVSSTLDLFIYRNKYKRRINDQFEPIFEAAIQEELQSILVKMLSSDQNNQNLATFLSWAIFGSLIEESKNKTIASHDSYIKEVVNLAYSLLHTYVVNM